MAVEIRDPDPGAGELGTARRLIEEYVASLGIDLGFQEIEKELSEFPAAYAPPGGRILLAFVEGEAAGCVGIRSLRGDCCEMKRLYVRPAFRGSGLGRELALSAIDAARRLGYRSMRLDTLAEMDAARSLYRSLGFREIAPYRFNPEPGASFMELKLG